MREPIPGDEDPFHGSRDEIPGVAVDGIITAVDPRNGILKVRIEQGSSVRPDIKLPMVQFSFALGRSSWFRFIPQVGDTVTLVQGMDGSMHIINFEAINYGQLADEDAADQFIYRELKAGEYELRSAGRATVWGSADGTLQLTGGPVSITLSKDRLESILDGSLHRQVVMGSEVRFGEVRRQLLPTDTEETALTGGTLREHRTYLAHDAGVAALPVIDIKLGDVVDDIAPFIPTMGSGGGPLRAHVRVYDAAGATLAFELEVDALGNTEATQASTAATLGLKLVGLLSPFLAQYKDFTLQPTTTIKLGGPSAIEPIPLGTQLNAFLQALMDALNSAVIATAMGPASFNPATLAALQALKGTYLTSNLILSDVSYTQKLPTPGTV
jgi:hypothetical protein